MYLRSVQFRYSVRMVHKVRLGDAELLVCFLLFVTISNTWVELTGAELTDVSLSTAQLITKDGYPLETHHVTTDDGYILGLHRIPTKSGRPVIIMHGILDSSSTWVLGGPKTGLGYILSDLGYDIWLANARGNVYSKRHKRFNPNGTRHERKQYWNFSWHEIGVYDLPAIIDYVSAETNYTKMHFIGHSQGVTAFLVMTSERPEYNDKILLMNALAPAVYMSNVGDRPVQIFAKYSQVFEFFSDMLGIYDYSTEMDDLLHTVKKTLCPLGLGVSALCNTNFSPIAGNISNHINASFIPVLELYKMAGASFKQFFHFAQLIRNHRFSKFDYGKVGNMEKYGRTTAPDYSLDNCKVPVALFYSDQDRFAQAANVKRLIRQLPNVFALRRIRDDTFNHIDFVWAMDAKDLLYKYVFNLMRIVESKFEK